MKYSGCILLDECKNSEDCTKGKFCTHERKCKTCPHASFLCKVDNPGSLADYRECLAICMSKYSKLRP